MSTTITALLLKEMEREAITTRKMLALVPTEKFDWKPHEKSMSLQQLAGHIAELPSWIKLVLTTSELDFEANPYQQPAISSNKDLLALYEKSLAEGSAQLAKATDADLEPNWSLRSGATIYSTDIKTDVLRMCFCQTVHHRAQLGVYLRLLNIPIPGSYGPSADDMSF